MDDRMGGPNFGLVDFIQVKKGFRGERVVKLPLLD